AISADPHQVRAHAFAAFRELMTLLRARQPVVLLIDDLQWSDPDSLHLLVELMALPDPPPLLLVATLRPGADAIKSRLAGDVRELRLGGLDKAEAIALAKTLLGERDMPRAESIARETRGHPLFIDELARRAATESLRSTLNLDDALWGRIHELDENQRAVVESVAVAGIPVSLSVIAATTKLATGDLTAELAPLRAARLVKTSFSGDRERIEPYHDRVRESVLAHIGQADRVEWHRRLADALDADGAIEPAPLALVEHLEAAGEAERAAANAYAAGERAMQVLAFDHAADLFAIALRLGKYEADKTRELQLKVAQAYGHAGRGPEGARQYLAVALDADPERRTEYVSEAAQHLFGSGHLQRGLALLEELTSECGISWPQTSRRALANLLWQRARLRIRGLRWREQDASAVNHRDRVRLKLYWSLSIALAALDPVRSGVYAAQYLRLGLRLGQPTHVAFGLTLEAINVGLASASAARRAHQVLDAARAVKLPAPDRVLDAFIAQANGAICFATGQFDEALPHLEKAEALSEEPRAVWLRTSTRLIRLYCAAHTGRYRWAQIAAETYLRDARRRGDLYAVASYANGACEAMTYQGRTAQARRLLDTTHWTPPEGDYHTANYSRLFLRIHADLFDGIPAEQTEAREAAEFKTLASALLMFVQLIRSESRWLRAKLAIAIAARQPHPQARLAQAEKLARQIDREDVPFTTTWALGLRAGIASVRRQPEQAADLLRKCIGAARENQMRGIAAAAERALGRLIGGDEGAKLVATAEAWMESEDVTNPDGLTRVLLPGFCELQPPRLLSAGT
ncbi:MAG TPA: AAA family ATPase, partial [Kofleriaceae bacterium]